MQTWAGFPTLRSPDRCLEDRVHLNVEGFVTSSPLTFDLPADAIVVFVGVKPINETIERRKWLERMPEKTREWFESVEKKEKEE